MITLEQFKALVGDLARPYAIVVSATAFATACIILALRDIDLDAAAWFVGAMGATVTGLYAGKVVENRGVKKAEAEVEKVRAAKGSPAPDPEPEATDDPTMFGGPRG